MKHKTLDRRRGMKVATILSSNSVDHKSHEYVPLNFNN